MILYSTPPVVAKLMGGLGNQMFQLAAALGVASRFDGNVAIDTSFYSQTGDWTPRPFSLHQAFPQTRQFLEAGPEIWQSLPHVIQGNGPYIEEFSKIAFPVYLDGYWQSEHCFSHCKDDVRSLFSFHSIPESGLPYVQRIRSTEAVSLHIRRGDYVHTATGNRIHNVCGLAYYRNALHALLQQVNAPTLFVFCDEPDWARENFQADIPWEVVDTGLPHEPWHDMHLMSLCKHHIVANSSFSWWGAWLGQFPGVVLAPDRWNNLLLCGIPDVVPELWQTAPVKDQSISINDQDRGISFFIPAYNCERWIEESVNSIMETNFTENDELIIVNDCSTDSTRSVLQRIADSYPCVKIMHHTINMGGGATRNTAIYNATHDLLFCLDSDNVLEKNSIEPLKQFLIAQNADVASFGEIKFFLDGTEKEQTTHSWVYKEPDFSFADALATIKFPGASGNYMFTKNIWKAVRGYIPHVEGLDTWSFGIRKLAAGAKMVVLRDTFYYHRHGMDNSYWCAFTKKQTPSLVASSILLPYANLLEPESLDYILNEGRYTWFENIEYRPLHVK